MEKYSIILWIKTFSTLKTVKRKKIIVSRNVLKQRDIHVWKNEPLPIAHTLYKN